jgi:mono/diheme cytochrome c family protein
MKWNNLGFLAGIIFLLFIFVYSCQSGPRPGTLDYQAQQGKIIYEEQCISCHGMGDIAPTIDTLSEKAPDLAQIMKRRPKEKEFPVADIARMIDGRILVKAHGPRTMPVWGEKYTEEGLDDGEIRGRKGELVAYLMMIQEK